jgi:hypothetical protein
LEVSSRCSNACRLELDVDTLSSSSKSRFHVSVAAAVVVEEEAILGRRYDAAFDDERDDDGSFITVAAEAAAPLLPSPCSSASIDAANSLNLLALSSSMFEAPSPPSSSPLTDAERLEGRDVRGVAGEGCRRRAVDNDKEEDTFDAGEDNIPVAVSANPPYRSPVG